MLIPLIIAWVCGIVLAGTVDVPEIWLWCAAGLGLLGAPLLWKQQRGRLAALCLLLAALGGLRYQAELPDLGPQRVELLAGQAVRLRGLIAEEPRRSEQGQRVVLAVEAGQAGGPARALEGRVLLMLPPYPAYRYGQRVLVAGELSEPRGAERPGDFDYRAYLAHRGIYALIREPEELRLLAEGRGPLAALLDFRERCRALLLRTLPEPQASLAIGIILGIQSGVPDEVQAAFSATGTSHILVVSGWNFTIVAALLAAVAGRLSLGRWQTFWLSLAAMWAYALFTGGSAAVLRAATMASLVVLARGSERQTEPWRLLFAACGIISLANPHTLWDLGFQLSALATASLFAFAKPVEGWLTPGGQEDKGTGGQGNKGTGFLPFAFCLLHSLLAPAREALTATLAAQVLTLPLILYHFGNLSVIAPLANVLVVPVVPFAMLLGTVAMLGGLAWLPLGQWLGLAAWLPLTWLAEGVRLLAAPSWAALTIPPFPLWALLAYYAAVAGLWLRGRG